MLACSFLYKSSMLRMEVLWLYLVIWVCAYIIIYFNTRNLHNTRKSEVNRRTISVGYISVPYSLELEPVPAIPSLYAYGKCSSLSNIDDYRTAIQRDAKKFDNERHIFEDVKFQIQICSNYVYIAIPLVKH